jgi:hypothetical protein
MELKMSLSISNTIKNAVKSSNDDEILFKPKISEDIETIDIVQLIESNPITKLTKPYQSRLINKIKHSFTTDEQQLFFTSFYCYLNFNKDDFVIDLDDIWTCWIFSKSKS